MTNTVVLRPRSPGGLLGRADKRFLATAGIEARYDALVITDGAGTTTAIRWDRPGAVKGVRQTTLLDREASRTALPHKYLSLIDAGGRELAVLPLRWWDIDEAMAFASTVDVSYDVDMRYKDEKPVRADGCVELKPAGSGWLSATPLLIAIVAAVAALVAWAVTGQWLWVGAAVLILAIGAPVGFKLGGSNHKTDLTRTAGETEPPPGTRPEEQP